ncbi:MAG TPA: glycosyltransferase family 2 protein [Candidatus Limnocylindrales bacterium]|nr:glycosyltransferase family 2 protein [Candidatus Limnocylindrales bacterium]
MTQPAGPIHALIPAYQEGPRIGAVVEGARRHLPVIVVDDGSSDETAAAAEAAGAEVLRSAANAGKGAALRHGFRHALERGAPAVVTLDADGQHDPAEIPAFLRAFEARRPELIIGRRDFGAMPPLRRASNTLGGAVLSLALGRSVPDNQSGYRLIGRTLMGALLDSDETGFEFEVEMIGRAIALGLPIDWVPIRTIYAGEPSHIRPWRHFTEFVRISRKARRIARGG